MVFKIESLDRRKHQRGNFSCGIDSLDRYIQQQASQDLKKNCYGICVNRFS
ncbi:MAG: hypothetical protein QNJ55_07185 [Xenococcus sp. MO_188.B8]|nr:hypothetical protein [Xenococcus sp. MO_188.B8]